MAHDDELLQVRLSRVQRDLLIRAMNQWGGPAYGTNSLAVAMGFADYDALLVEAQSLMRAIDVGRPLSRRDWTRALLATEIAWVSEVVGAAGEWGTIFGDRDVDVLRELRGAQAALHDVILRATLDGREIF